MKRYDIINQLIKKNNFKRYLEIGLDKGTTYNRVLCDYKVSVDAAEGKYSHANPTFKMTSDEFFEQNGEIFDIIFIDGLHHADQVYKDIVNSLQCLSENGIIVCHDMNPITKKSQEVPRTQSLWNGDVWKAWVKLRCDTSHSMVVVDTDHGCGIINPSVSETNPLDIELPSELTYEFLNDNRVKLLNLINVNTWEQLV